MFQKVIQFAEAISDVWWIGFMGFLIDLVELVQDGFAVAVAGIKGVFRCRLSAAGRCYPL